MLKLQSFKFELMPNGTQELQSRRFEGPCRYIYNKALAIQKENHEAGNKFISYVSMAKHLTPWRNDPETPWLKEAPYHCQQQALKNLDRSFKNFFEKRSDFPCFKKRSDRGSFRFPDSGQIKLDQANSRVFLPKLGWIRYRKSRNIEGKVCNATVTHQGEKWFVSIQTERKIEKPIERPKAMLGIDMGIARFATMHDGTYIEPLNSFKKYRQRLAKYQRRMSRKIKFSKNWHKARVKVRKVHTKIKDVRKDFIHKATTKISKNHALVCVEDLKIRSMSKSARGTAEKPGKNIKQKSTLNCCILDQGWGMFRSQLGYKLEWNGGMLLSVAPHYTSQECPLCNHTNEDNRKTQTKFRCVSCDYENHADVVGAINVLERGYRLLACGEVDISLFCEPETHRSELANY